MAGVAITIESVSKKFVRGDMEVHALREVSLDIAAGEFVAIMGPSGSGKSTLLQLVGGLDRASSGRVRIGSVALDTLEDPALARYRLEQVGFIFQFFNLLPAMTAVENVAVPLLIGGQPRKQALARAEAVLGKLGLQQRQHHKPDELSGGQMQRVAIARALVTDAPLLLADEPTGNLDSKMGQEVMRLIAEIRNEYGQTVVMVTHDPEVARCASRTITLRDGAVAEDKGVEPHAASAGSN